MTTFDDILSRHRYAYRTADNRVLGGSDVTHADRAASRLARETGKVVFLHERGGKVVQFTPLSPRRCLRTPVGEPPFPGDAA